jgi:hypothetical protein
MASGLRIVLGNPMRPPRLTRGYELWLWIFLVMSLPSLIVGIVRGNAIVYALGDVFKYLYFSLGFFVISFCLTTVSLRRRLFQIFIALGVLYTVTGLLSQFYNLAILGQGTISRGIEKAVWIYYLLVLMLHQRLNLNTTAWWRHVMIIGATLASAVISRSRRDILFIAVGLIFSIGIIPKKVFYSVKLGQAFLVLLVVAASLLLLSPTQLQARYSAIWTSIANRVIVRTFNSDKELDASSQTRFIEIEEGSRAVLDSSLGSLSFFIGMGAGAEYLSSTVTTSGSSEAALEQKHQIHNTYFSILFRSGIFTLLSLLLFLSGLLFDAFKHLYYLFRRLKYMDPQSSRDAVRFATLFLSTLIFLIVEWNVAYTFGDINTILILGMLGAEMRYAGSKE